MGRKHIDIDGVFYSVKKFKEEKKLKKGIAYIVKDLVLPYYGYPVNKKEAGIYMNDNEEYVIIRPITKLQCMKYSVNKIYEVDDSKKFVEEMLKKTGVKAEKMDVILSESDSVFAPVITPEDNILARIIKKALIEKQIDLKDYMPRFENQTDMSNFKKSLLSHPKMSFEKFTKWCYILDLKFEFIVTNSEDAVKPLNNDIIEKYE